jgi:electron transfer flavoprotein beta subunit
MAMHILVCIKQVLDPEIPPALFRVNRAERRADVPGAAWVMSTFDANALETALQLRDALGAGSSVTALSLGPREAETVLRKALGVTADSAVLLSGPELGGLDSAGVATAIAAAVRRLGDEGRPVDLVLTGRQAADWEHGQTGGMIAEALGWPCLTFASRLRPVPGGLEARREVEDGHEIVVAHPPLVATITNDATNRLRLAKVRDVMRAHRTPIATWGAAEVGLDVGELAPRTEVVDLVVPERESHCELVGGETPAEQAATLARRLRDLGIL